MLLLRDLIERHGVANFTALRWLVRRLLSSPAGQFSVTKFAADLKSQGIAVSRETLYDFLSHLEGTHATNSGQGKDTKPGMSELEKLKTVVP
ncbi:MAG: hypothetical protein NTW21_15425 [Verrucomicrobia bacterium]|nr:hypothetical protein [Verrucomicrobiota bacterium]